MRDRADEFSAENAKATMRHRVRTMRVSIGLFNTLVGQVRGAARQCGYAVAVHGSLLRDIDLLAVPWTKEAAAPTKLINAIIEAVGKFQSVRMDEMRPTKKPHGRLSWSIHVGGTYIDLSVMPRK